MSEELIQKIRKVIANAQRLPVEKVTIDSSFEELGIDSMDGVNILFALENEFNITIPDEAAKQIRNVRERPSPQRGAALRFVPTRAPEPSP